MKSTQKHLELLDYMRGVAILAVLLLHALSDAYGFDVLPWGTGFFRQFTVSDSFLFFLPISVMAAGVPIFFVVSGFCIHVSFQQQEQRWLPFFIRRAFRIYPAYFAALIFSIGIALIYNRANHFGMGDRIQLLTHLFLIHNCGASYFYGTNASFWSLAIEVQLYILYPALLVLVARYGWHPTMLILMGCESLIRGTDGLVQTMGATTTEWGQISWLLAASPFGFWFSWSLGALIADAYLKKRPLPFTNTPLIWWFTLVIVSYFVKPMYPFRFLLFAVITAVVTSRLLNTASPKITIHKLFWVILKQLGLWSYSIYLLHQPILNIYSHLIEWVVPSAYHTAPIMFFFNVVVLLAMIPLCFLWYKLLELPSIAFGKLIIGNKNLRYVSGIKPAGPIEMRHQPEIVYQASRSKKTTYCIMIATLIIFIALIFFGASKLAPREPWENNDLAWSLATNPEASRRNGPLAVKLAEDVCSRTHYRVTLTIGTLAAAYAEAGRFDDAISAARLACVVADKNGQTNLYQRNLELLQLYQLHKPFHESESNNNK